MKKLGFISLSVALSSVLLSADPINNGVYLDVGYGIASQSYKISGATNQSKRGTDGTIIGEVGYIWNKTAKGALYVDKTFFGNEGASLLPSHYPIASSQLSALEYAGGVKG